MGRGKRKLQAQVVIIGGGIVGTAVARELSKYKLDLLLVEKEAEVGWGTTKANSGIVHGGFHEKPGTLKAKYCFLGNQIFPGLCRELNVNYRQNGSLLVARSEEEMALVRHYYGQGRERGVSLRLLGREETLALEPNLVPSVTGALFAPQSGAVMPFELAGALMENAISNGTRLLLQSPVQKAWVREGLKYLETPTEVIAAEIVINAAGLFCEEVARLFGDDFISLRPRKGEEYIFDVAYQNVVQRTIFPVPTKVSKGILVIPTSEGNLMIGPTSDEVGVGAKEDLDTSREGFARVLEGARSLVPSLDPGRIIAQFAGVRATSAGGDFIVEFSPKVPGLLHLAGIESPGLTAAPALAAEVPRLLQGAGLGLVPKEDFQPRREGILRFRELPREKQAELIRQNPAYGRIICRCETVTEAEIVAAIKGGARTLDGIKFRTRAGAGRCQGGFCQPYLLSILSRELGLPPQQITKRGPGSEIVQYHAKELLREGAGS